MPSHDLWYMHDVRSQTRWITKRREKKMITKCAQIDYEILSIYNQLHACMQQTHQRSTNIPTIGAISYSIAHVHRNKVNCKFNRKHFCFYRLNKNCLVWKKKKMTNYIQDIGSEWNVQWVVNRAHTYTNTPNRRRVFCCLDRSNLVQKVRIQVRWNLYLRNLFTLETDFFFV